ncbi:MAG: hypothetical protein WD738_07130 [Pirellulales bacterium]
MNASDDHKAGDGIAELHHRDSRPPDAIAGFLLEPPRSQEVGLTPSCRSSNFPLLICQGPTAAAGDLPVSTWVSRVVIVLRFGST